MKDLGFRLIFIFLFILVGFTIPKILIKTPELGSSPCLDQAIKDTSKLPTSLWKTAQIEELDRANVRIRFYTIFAIKLPQEVQMFCTSIK